MKKDAIVLLHGFDHDHRCWELYIDAPHDCMLTDPKKVAEIILEKYDQCLK